MTNKAFLLVAIVVLLAVPALAAPPEIAHIAPDYLGNHIRTVAPNVIVGENFSDTGMELYTWTLTESAAVVEETAKLLGTGKEPRLPDQPPLTEEGRKPNGTVWWAKGGYPNFDIIYRWAAPWPDMGMPVFDVNAGQRTMVANLSAARADRHTAAVWLKNKDGFSRPYLMNTAQPRWMSRNSLQQGEALRIYGLGLQMRFKQSRLAFRKGGVTRILLPEKIVFSADQDDTHLLQVAIPDDMEPGDYRVYVHNDVGGRFGWAEAGPLTVEKKSVQPENIVRVREHGALGDGEANDTAAIRKAIAAAAASGGGVVYFAPGTYIVDESVTVPSRVSLRGAGQQNTIIEGVGFNPHATGGRRYWNSNLAPAASVLLLQPWTGMERLTVKGAVGRGTGKSTVEAIEGDANTPPLPDKAGLGQIILQDIEVFGSFGGGQRTGARAYGLQILSSAFHGGIGLSALTRRADIIGNTIYGSSISFMGGLSDSLIDRNVMRDAPTRFATLMPVHNSYIRQNGIYDFGTKGQSGGWGVNEAYLAHAGSLKSIGKVTVAGADSLTDSRQAWRPGQFSEGKIWHMNGKSTVLITAGRGFGQYRQVKSNTETTVTVDRPWRVVPDETSEYMIGNFYVDNTWYDNYLDGPAIVGLDGDQINTVVEKQRQMMADNIFMRTYVDGGRKSPSPAWYNMLLNNETQGCGIYFNNRETADKGVYTAGPQMFGNMIIGNSINDPLGRDRPAGAIRIGAESVVHVPTNRTLLYTIISGNSIRGAEGGIELPSWARFSFITGNSFNRVGKPLLDFGSGTVAVGNAVVSLSEEKNKDIRYAAGTTREPLPDYRRPDDLAAWTYPEVQYFYPPAGSKPSARSIPIDRLLRIIPEKSYIPSDVASAAVQKECVDNLKKLYGALLDYEKKNGFLPRAAFYPDKPLTDPDSLLVLLGKEARPFLRCPAAGPDFDSLGWPNYIWNDELSGRKLSDVKDRKGTWLLMDFSAAHPWMVLNSYAGHRGGANILYADGGTQWLAAGELQKKYPFEP